jgi:localization factor PodJL
LQGDVAFDPEAIRGARAMVEDMNRAMAWNIAGVSRRTRDAAVEAARRAGIGLDDWLNEAIAGHAGLDPCSHPDRGEALDDRLDAALGRLERMAQRNAPAQQPRGAGIPGPFDSVIERFEVRLARAEAQAARAFESVAQILERDTAVRDSDRRALIEAVRRLESIRANLTGSAESGETRDRFARPPALDPKPSFDLKAAASQIAMRRHELEARAGGTAGMPPDPPVAHRAESSAAEGDRDAAPGAADDAPPLTQLLLDDVRALGRKLEDMRRERAEPSGSAVDLSAMRGEIDAMRRSLTDLAPRNAVVALEGAIRDLVQRVEMLRQSGHGESMLAPLEAMAAEFRAAVKAHDPQAAAAGLEREIRAIGGKIDSLAAAAIKPETFERIRQQTEEVRNLLASAALRTAPLERLERQIGELADRVERLGASPAPHFETAEMAALLAEACRQIERSTPPAALASIERRLEQIAARLDQEIARPTAPAATDPGPFDDLARRIDSVRQSLEARPTATVDTGPIEKLLREFDAKLDAAAGADADAQALQSIFIEIREKLDSLADGEAGARQLEPVLHELGARIDAAASPVDLNPIESLLRGLEAKFEASANAPVDREVIQQVADEVASRLREMNPRTDLEALSQQIDAIYDRVDALAAQATANDPGPVARELLERLREADKAEGSSALETSAAVHAALDAHLSELKAEQASADRRTQSRLADLQSVLETLTARLAGIEGELAGDDVDEELRPPARTPTPAPPISSAAPGNEALGPELAPQCTAQPKATASLDDATSQPADGEDFLIEPGAGGPQRAREARELAQLIGPKTNPSVSVHIAAARRAAQAALAENAAAATSSGVRILTGADRAPFAARGLQTARAFYASHKRTVLLGVAVAIAATLAVRLAGVRAPFLQRSELGGQAVNTAKIDAPKSKPADVSGPAKSGEAIDIAPTASIAQPPAKPGAPGLAPESGPSAGELIAAIPPGIPQSLRDAAAAGQPAAQYELATRLFEGRGLPKDQPAAARWFERAASLGLAPAQYRLGAMYEKGIGVTPDPAAAKRWYLKAAEAGNARAAYNLAVMSADSSSGEANYLEAAKWFRKAAELGVRDSQYNLAMLYARGLGVDKDLSQSFLWFALAAQQGDTDAAKKRNEIAGQMDPALLASAVEALMKFKAVKLDPAANDVAAPPGGWDAKPGSLSQSPADAAHPQPPL